MRAPFAPGVGGVLSADIAVSDHERELGFYSAVLTTGSDPLWRDDLMNNRGTPVIGLGARTPEYEALPLQWMPHFQVADIGASVARTLELGGKEFLHPKDDSGQSQWAVLADQDGAAFGLIPVVADDSYAVDASERIGCISWLTLVVPEVSSSRDFYQQVIGWAPGTKEVEECDSRIARVEMQRDDEISAAEICRNAGDHDGIPPVWLICLPVADFTESLRRVREGGGEVIRQSTDGDYAVIRDPVGVYMALKNG